MSINPTTNATGALTERAGMPNAEMGKDEFLKLLIVPLSQQDPLNPQDSTQFVQQLATFTSLERLQNIQDGLGMVALASTATNSTLAADFIGKHVEIGGSDIGYAGRGSAELHFNLDSDAAEVEIEIKNDEGEVVRTITTTGTEGANTLVWDGKTDDGEQAPTGKYSFSIANATNEDGEAVEGTTKSVLRVQAVTFKNGHPELILANGQTIQLAEVMAVVDTSSDD